MELTLVSGDVQWLPKPLKKQAEAPREPKATSLSVLLSSAVDEESEERSLPCEIAVPVEDLEPDAVDNEKALLNRHVTFKLMDGDALVATHALKLRECIPVLAEGTIHWKQPVLHKDVLWELNIRIHVKTDRRPRALISTVITIKNQATKLARQLSLHKNKAVIGLLPAFAGCVIGVVATSPVWLPLTVLVGVLGFPVWFVVGVAMAMVIVFSTISTIVTVQLVRSKRVKDACQHFLRSPQGQLLLFQGLPGEEFMSASALSERATEFVLANSSRKLVASLIIDFLGTANFAVPVVGELADLLWAPVSAKMVNTLYSESSPQAKYVAFVEEVLPFTDFIPTATLAWLKENFSSEELDKLLVLMKIRQA
ncbi:hypothetical protein PHYBOEH_001947 [Phytophthora boehmeriae]|uniref:Transmembrane protein n=1 Tax=Phytophthora boehmeriae TaxID=109152 RepID=A0A8T1WXZ6_9STRA|nr:hypothetical protein PHYBOEH_001947 [Phytophthora boehmeriae]